MNKSCLVVVLSYQQMDLDFSMTSCYFYEQCEVGTPASGTDLYVESIGLVTRMVPVLLASKSTSFEVRTYILGWCHSFMRRKGGECREGKCI